MQSSAKHKGSVADILIRRCSIAPKDLETACKTAHSTGMRLELVLEQQGLVNEEQTALAVAEYLNLPAIPLSRFTPDQGLVGSLPPAILHEMGAAPLARWGGCLAVAVKDPFDLDTLGNIVSLAKCEVLPYVAPKSQIADLIARCGRSTGTTLKDVLREVDRKDASIEVASSAELDMSTKEILDLGEQAPAIRIVNSILIEALYGGASDIHVEPMEDALHMRYRIDGVLHEQPKLPLHMQWAVTSRLKIIAQVDIAERRLPQDGRFTVRTGGLDVDVRANFIPTVYGQKTVLRLLDKRKLKSSLSDLDMDPSDYKAFRRAISQPSGLILVTGPTGSGKTSTLYSILQELSKPSVNVVTVEDPVEYTLTGINQIPVRSEIGLTFANGLRAILRQDPNVIMVGEIRDNETAGIAIQAALTGHLVLSTLHTRDAAGAVVRLVNMGIDPLLVSSSLLLAQAQRLFRLLCPYCKSSMELSPDILRRHEIDPGLLADARLYAPTGCVRCKNLGYSGRKAVMEILEVDRGMQDLILRECSAEEIRQEAQKTRGMRTLMEAGMTCVRQGITSLEEVLRVIGQV